MDALDFSIVARHISPILRGFGVTLELTIVACLAGTALAVPVALLMLSRNRWVRLSAVAAVEAGKAVPILVALVWIHYGISGVFHIRTTAFQNAVTAFTLSLAAFLADILRGGIASIPKGHVEAAVSLGLSPRAVLNRVIIPEAVRRSLPGAGAMYITTLKLSTVASVIGVPDVLYAIKLINLDEPRPYELYTALAVIFIIIVVPTSMVTRWLEKHPWFAISPNELN
jgi:polar amino acid transport system permease protein